MRLHLQNLSKYFTSQELYYMWEDFADNKTSTTTTTTTKTTTKTTTTSTTTTTTQKTTTKTTTPGSSTTLRPAVPENYDCRFKPPPFTTVAPATEIPISSTTRDNGAVGQVLGHGKTAWLFGSLSVLMLSVLPTF